MHDGSFINVVFIAERCVTPKMTYYVLSGT